MRTGRRRSATAHSALPVLALLAASGCGWLRPGGPPDEALIELSSPDIDRAALVTSHHFDWVPDPDCTDPVLGCPNVFHVSAADTTIVALPYTTTIKFTASHLLFAETYPEELVEARLAMRVEIDGEQKYNNFATLRPEDDEGNRETMWYTYSYSGRL